MPLFSQAQAIPDRVINEGAAFKPFDLTSFITYAGTDQSHLRFEAGLADGQALPQGLICTSTGTFTGIPAKGTEGSYQISVVVQDIEGEKFAFSFNLMIKPINTAQPTDLLRDLKAKVWTAVGNNQPLPQMPELNDLLAWPVTAFDVYYLLERFAYLTVWDAYNTAAPGKLVLLNLKGASQQYNVYDRGSCIVATPKDLYSQVRTQNDALITSRAIAEEVYKRGWAIEFSGFDKMVRAAWVKLQVLGKKHDKYTEILHYRAPAEDMLIYNKEVGSQLANPAP